MKPLVALQDLLSLRLRAGGINRAPSPVLALATPWFSVMLASLLPSMPMITSAPVLPPLGLMLLLAWSQVRPGLLPIWAGLPLGAFDDLYSGQPFGSAILLWSLVMILLFFIEHRIPWRNFLLDWLKKPEFMVHHAWTAHEIAVWDNRSTQHYALADYWPHHRVNQRATFDVPGTAAPAATPNQVALKGRKLRT